MHTIIRFLTDILTMASVIALFVMIEKVDRYIRFKKKFKTGQRVKFYAGNNDRIGEITKIKFTKAHITDIISDYQFRKPLSQIYEP